MYIPCSKYCVAAAAQRRPVVGGWGPVVGDFPLNRIFHHCGCYIALDAFSASNLLAASEA